MNSIKIFKEIVKSIQKGIGFIRFYLLDKMLHDFPDEERNIQIKRAYVLKEMKNAEAGLEIINDLIQKNPKDNDLLNYKVCWLQYLNRKEESIDLIEKLIERIPNSATYHDTYGEF